MKRTAKTWWRVVAALVLLLGVIANAGVAAAFFLLTPGRLVSVPAHYKITYDLQRALPGAEAPQSDIELARTYATTPPPTTSPASRPLDWNQDRTREVVDILRRRVDPARTDAFVWRVVEANRFEVVVPIRARPYQARKMYEQALKDLQAGAGAQPAVADDMADQLNDVLSQYVAEGEARAMRSSSPAELKRRQRAYTDGLRTLKEKWPSKAGAIDKVCLAYEGWMDQRRPREDPSDLDRLIRQAGVLEFRIAPYAPESREEFSLPPDQRDLYTDQLTHEGPLPGRKRDDAFQWFPIRGRLDKYSRLVTAQYDGKTYLLLYNQLGLSMLQRPDKPQWSIRRSIPGCDRSDRPALDFELDERGADLFSKVTAANIGHSLAILIDNRVYTAPILQGVISSRAQVTGDFSNQEVVDLASLFNAKPIPAGLDLRRVGVEEFPECRPPGAAGQTALFWIVGAVGGLGMLLAMVCAMRGRADGFLLAGLVAAASAAAFWQLTQNAPFAGRVPAISLWVNASFAALILLFGIVGHLGPARRAAAPVPVASPAQESPPPPLPPIT